MCLLARSAANPVNVSTRIAAVVFTDDVASVTANNVSLCYLGYWCEGRTRFMICVSGYSMEGGKS